MMKKEVVLSVGVLLLLSVAAYLWRPAHAAPPPADATPGRKLEDTPMLTVRGRAELKKPADRLLMSIGVVTNGPDPSEALDDNNASMRRVVKAIEKAGLGSDEHETGRFNIRPVYSRPPARQRPEGWKPEIVGYEVTNSINVRTGQLDLAGKIIGVASKAGANSVDVAGFDLADSRTHRREAIAVATANARADAQDLADAAEVDLRRIVSINLDDAVIPRPEMAFKARGRAAMAADSAPPITPGDVTVRASVTIVYEISEKGQRD
ncbi:MAG: SIMPL domain-containing protein [Planctomycetes bacterium]|nr:SIMPL domain-containing protein [Planctomycetota bacterium]